MNKIKIGIIGLGYVVLTLAVKFAKKYPDKFYSAVVLAFAHDQFINFPRKNYVKGSHIIYDVKQCLPQDFN